jgi:branched-chain amino acid transport system ATP-binding protein
VGELYEKVGELALQGIAILLVEQFATAAMKVAEYAAIMRHGRIATIGEPADVADDLTAAYLGAMA